MGIEIAACGEGTFLKNVDVLTQKAIGIEIQKSYVKDLNSVGIDCVESLNALDQKEIDTIFCFHTLEHLKEPIQTLKSFKKVLKNNSHLVVEVPHANDFLLRYLKSESFKNFTLWSQHLILHTRKSLEVFLREAGFSNFIIQGKQRYKISNHFQWLSNDQPGGHKSILSSIDTDELTSAYERSLQMIDATDTLVAIVESE